MRWGRCRIEAWYGLVLLAAILVAPQAGRGAFLYKNYVLRSDQGQDILCAPYVVQKHDWVYKILKLRGDIAQDDFPEFLSLFGRLNPNIDDINTIRPGQQIVIPLRKVQRENLPMGPSGTITIPFVYKTGQGTIPEAFKREYVVQRGDCVSKLIAPGFGDFGSKGYQEAEALFRRLNPQVADLARIYPGQRLILVDSGIRKLPTYPLLRASGSSRDPMPSDTAPAPSPAGQAPVVPPSPLSRMAELLQATVMNRGVYFFPKPGGTDAGIDLARTPLVTLPDGTRLLVSHGQAPDQEALAAARRFFPRLFVVSGAAEADPEAQMDGWLAAVKDRLVSEPLTFSDRGVQVTVRARWMLRLPGAAPRSVRYLCVTPVDTTAEQTPDLIRRYLEAHGIRLREMVRPGPSPATAPVVVGKIPAPPGGTTMPRALTGDVRHFVADLMLETGFAYAARVNITFPYAGMQIQTVSNVVHIPQGTPLFIDFGDLYGDAVDAIERTGFKVIRIGRQMPREAIVDRVLAALGVTVETRPTFLAAERPPDHNTELIFPGVLRPATTERPGQLITPAELDERLRLFLAQRHVQVLSYSEPQASGPGRSGSR